MLGLNGSYDLILRNYIYTHSTHILDIYIYTYMHTHPHALINIIYLKLGYFQLSPGAGFLLFSDDARPVVQSVQKMEQV